MAPSARLRRIRTALLVGAAALAPAALGVAMHLEHEATLRACEDLLTGSYGLGPALAPGCAQGTPRCERPSAPESPAAAAAPDPPPARLGDPGGFAFVVALPAPHVVLATEIDGTWIAGEPTLERNEDYDAIATRPLAIDRLPAELRARTGRAVRLFGGAGELCTGVLGEPRLVAEISGDPTYLADDERGAADVFDAAQTWEHGRRLLVAPVHVATACEGALWARDARFAAPGVYARVPGLERTTAAIRGAYLRLPEVRKRKAEFDEYVASDAAAGKPPSWSARVHATAWVRPGATAAMYVLGSAGEEFYGCGGLVPSWGAVAVDGEGEPVRADFVGEDTPLLVVDVDGDGHGEVIAEGWFGARRLVAIGETGPSEVAALPEVPFYGCPC